MAKKKSYSKVVVVVDSHGPHGDSQKKKKTHHQNIPFYTFSFVFIVFFFVVMYHTLYIYKRTIQYSTPKQKAHSISSFARNMSLYATRRR